MGVFSSESEMTPFPLLLQGGAVFPEMTFIGGRAEEVVNEKKVLSKLGKKRKYFLELS